MRNGSLLLLLGLLSCGSPQPDTADSPARASTAPAPTPAAATDPGPARQVRQFLGWYAERMDQPGLYEEFVTNAAYPGGQNYAVDFKATEVWLSKLRRTGLFSAAYTDDWRQYFRAYADTLRRHPQNDGPPAGFDYDLFLSSQEPDDVLHDLQAGTFRTRMLGPDRARVQARGPRHESWQHGLDFVLSRTPDRHWLIDSISNEGQTF